MNKLQQFLETSKGNFAILQPRLQIISDRQDESTHYTLFLNHGKRRISFWILADGRRIKTI